MLLSIVFCHFNQKKMVLLRVMNIISHKNLRAPRLKASVCFRKTVRAVGQAQKEMIKINGQIRKMTGDSGVNKRKWRETHIINVNEM